MEIINLNPRRVVQYQSEWNYYLLCYREGETSNNSILRDVALRRFKQLINEIYFLDVPAQDFKFPDYEFVIHKLNQQGHTTKIKTVQSRN